jgi:hypothetical protein
MTSPLREYEEARADLDDALASWANPGEVWAARRTLARAKRRLILSALAYIVVASAVAVMLWGLFALFAALSPATGPLPTDIQLPTI